MNNKDLFNKICNVSCLFNELEDFCIDINKKEFDLDNPFEKYYSVDRIISAIEKYQSKIIDAKFLAYWMNAYNWIIMGGFKSAEAEKYIPLKQILIWEITDWIDSLSFFDDSDDLYNLEGYKATFKVLDLALQEAERCQAVFAMENEEDDGCGADIIVLITNEDSKYFIRLYTDINDATDYLDKIDSSTMADRVEQLLKLGYQELQCGCWNDEDFDS